MDIKDLKAEAYDLIATIEAAKLRLQQVNQQIADLSRQEEQKAEQK